MTHFLSDHIGSDDMQMAAVLELSRQEASLAPATRLADSAQPSYVVRQELNGRISDLDQELKEVDKQIEDLRNLRTKIELERQDILRRLNARSGQQPTNLRASTSGTKSLGQPTPSSSIDYTNESFEWTGELKARMRAVFGIHEFRLCQEGVCNANMDGRDIVCIMPTGGGKSLTYQLPALLNPGCTLVISPLISLITDQILHLRQYGVEAVKLTGSTSKEDIRDIFSRLAATAGARNRSNTYNGHSPEIKLCYVTPEKIAKSKTFMSMLEKLANAGKLARIVIDEAHCVSQLGHDFRPDYKKLSILRQLFPRVPILALSATCPPKVLKDLIFTLRLKPVVPGTAANSSGTCYFSAPLYRKNLHYKVLPKPSSATAMVKTLVEYILQNHAKDSGIVYCLSKKDAETVAQGLYDESGGQIRTGVYHADVGDGEKERLHHRWRDGEIKVVCATIAFGLGIDKGDVRFVLHHSMSKSLEGYYQESGRAGRDGKDSDCVLFYRPQDSARLGALVCGEVEGQEKLGDMLRFAGDMEECRKLQFARYFSTSSSLSMSAWATTEADAHARCGHCDNCTRPPESIESRDVTLEAWQILQVAQAIERDGGRVTLSMLADLVRGAGGGVYGVGGGKRGKGKAKEKVGLDLAEIAGGKITLSKDDTETLLVNLLLSGHLKESFHTTAYAINVYVLPGANAVRLARYTREDIDSGKGTRIVSSFAKKIPKKQSRKSSGKQPSNVDAATSREGFFAPAKGKKRKRKGTAENSSDPENSFIDEEEEVMSLYADDDGAIGLNGGSSVKPLAGRKETHKNVVPTSDEDEDEDASWAFSMRPKQPASKTVTKNFSATAKKRSPLVGNSGFVNGKLIEILSDTD